MTDDPVTTSTNGTAFGGINIEGLVEMMRQRYRDHPVASFATLCVPRNSIRAVREAATMSGCSIPADIVELDFDVKRRVPKSLDKFAEYDEADMVWAEPLGLAEWSEVDVVFACDLSRYRTYMNPESFGGTPAFLRPSVSFGGKFR